MKLKELAELIQGELKGDPEIEIEGINSLYRAGKSQVAYIAEQNKNPEIRQIRAAALIIKKGQTVNYQNEIYVENPLKALKTVLEFFYPREKLFREISPLAKIEKNVKISANVAIGPFSWIGRDSEIGENSEIHAQVAVYPRVRIGKNCLIYSGVVIYPDTEIGDNVIIHSGSVIGADGFGYLRLADGRVEKIPQIGRVIVADWCEIGANSCIDRAALEETVLEENVKLDNLVQIGHNVRIGSNTTISAQCGIGGSTRIGKNVIFGGQVGVADHIQVADGVMAAGQTGITSTLKETGVYAGMPAQEIRLWRKNAVIGMQLEKIVDRLRILEKQLKELSKGGENER